YTAILQKLKHYEDEINIEIKGNYARRLGIKDEYIIKAEKINEECIVIKNHYHQLLTQHRFLCEKLKKLGCDIPDFCIGEPLYPRIPAEWYHYDQKIDVTKTCITIMFHKQTRF